MLENLETGERVELMISGNSRDKMSNAGRESGQVSEWNGGKVPVAVYDVSFHRGWGMAMCTCEIGQRYENRRNSPCAHIAAFKTWARQGRPAASEMTGTPNWQLPARLYYVEKEESGDLRLGYYKAGKEFKLSTVRQVVRA